MRSRRLQWLLLIIVIVLSISGCRKKEEPEPVATATPTPTPEETEAPLITPEGEIIPEGQVKSYLTGEYVDEKIGTRRPIAVMMNNVKAAVPQAGIGNAGVVYEAPVEGGITRLMSIIEDYDSLEKIGSMRSCRDYFIFYASGFNAIYVHYGQSAYAVPFLELPEVNNLSGLAGYGESVFYRTDDRPSPHNAYTSFEGVQKGIEINEYDQNYSTDYKGSYTFAQVGEQIDLTGDDASLIKPGYVINEPWFEYNPEDGLYYRFQYGAPQIDELTNEQLTFKNIIVQYSSWRNYDENGYLNIDVDAPGEGLYITNGKAVPVTWQKDEAWGPTYYHDASGEQITLNTGKTFVCIVQDTSKEDVYVGPAQAEPTE